MTFAVAGRSGMPSSAIAVTGVAGVANPSSGWAFYIGPFPQASPSTTNLYFAAGQSTSCGLTVALASSGTLSATYVLTTGNTTDASLVVTGYYYFP
jgi:hypothetical protein